MVLAILGVFILGGISGAVINETVPEVREGTRAVLHLDVEAPATDEVVIEQ